MKAFIKDILTVNIGSLSGRLVKLRKKLGWAYTRAGWTNQKLAAIPVIINNRNRLTAMLALIEWLEKAGMKNIYILDNESTYPPLLTYYANTPHKVIQLGQNVGHLALWKTPVFDQFTDQYYIYTDSDVVPITECPKDFLVFFLKALYFYPEIQKVGFGLKIDDLPDHYTLKDQVITHEKEFWKYKKGDKLYKAPIDTTFALYRPNVKGDYRLTALRTGEPYVARHTPWYLDTADLPEEEVYYKNHASAVSTWFSKLQ